MEEIKIADLAIQRDDSTLSFVMYGTPERRVAIEAEHISEIIDFLRSFRPNAAEERVGFRVPVGSLGPEARSSFSVSLDIGGERIAATAVDVSPTGILIDHEHLQAEVGDEFPVTLGYRDKVCKIDATVVRRDGTQVALHFPASLTDGELNPPRSLMEVYRALESEWLRERVT